ncbi:MAG TPA: hypothetical protein VEU08_00970 [Vicinamibacterales bacterium]|nr:hypothetical protein [Vicinamibacterales bacterium]
MKRLTRSKAIQIWFAAVGLVAAAAITFGANLTLGLWAVILGMCLVPPAMLFKLWPPAEPERSLRDMAYESKRVP